MEGLWQDRRGAGRVRVARGCAGPQREQGVSPTLVCINEAFLVVHAHVCCWRLYVCVDTCASVCARPCGVLCLRGCLQVILHVTCVYIRESGCVCVGGCDHVCTCVCVLI